MNTIRLGIYGALVVVVGMVAWVATGPDTTTTEVEVPSTAAPASTLPVDTPRTRPRAAETTASTSVPAPDQTDTASTTAAATGTMGPATAPPTTIPDGDEGTYDGTEPESIAVDFVITAFAECWSCDPEARQQHLGELAVPQVVAEWPPMSLEERSVFTVRTVTIDDVAVTDDTTIMVKASVTTETDLDPAATRSTSVEVRVVDGVVVAATIPTEPIGLPETTA